MANLTLHSLAISEPTGWGRTGLQFTNRDSTACSLAGFPIIALRDREGPIPFYYRHVGSPTRVVLDPRSSAFAMFGKFRCDLGDRRTAVTGQVWLPGESTARARFAPHATDALCKRIEGGRHTVIVTPFEQTLQAAYLHFFPRR